MDRRIHPRQTISLRALVHPDHGRSWPCDILNFCEHGMLLTGGSGSRSLQAIGTDLALGDRVALHFSVSTARDQRNFRIQAEVVWLLQDGLGMGIRLAAALDDDVIGILVECAAASGLVNAPPHAGAAPVGGSVESTPAETGDIAGQRHHVVEISEQAAGKVRRRIQDMAGRAIIRISEGFFDMAERTLSVKARDDGTAAPDCEYADALDQLKQHRETIKGGFLERIISQIEEVSDLESVIDQRRRRASSHSEKSSVGESDGFKEWLVMAEIIAKAENRFCDELFEIQTQMGLIAKPWGHKDAVPVGPATLSWAFNAAVEGLDIGRRPRQDILRCFEKAMNRVLENFYAELNNALASALEKELQ